MFSPVVSITDLKNKWVVFKRVKKQNWYHRGNRYQQCTQRSSKAALYESKETAVAEQTRLNVGRKAYKFRVECADKHFISNWSIEFDSWDSRVTIASSPIGIDRLAKQKATICHDINQFKEDTIKDIEQKLAQRVQNEVNIRNRYLETLKNAEAELERSLQENKNQVAVLDAARTWVQQTDLNEEYVEKYKTDMDKKAYILFGKRE